MSSRLFNLASTAARLLTGEGTRRALRGSQAQQQLTRLAEAALQPHRYEQHAAPALNDLLRNLGPIGQAIQAIIGKPSLRGRSEIDQAIALLQSLGADVLVRDPSSPHFQRGLRAARQLLDEVDRLPEPRTSPRTAPPRRPPPAPPTAPPAQPAGEWPEEHGVQLLGRGAHYYPRDWEELQSREIFTPSSSNVYSYVYEPETDSVGILYVTFRRWRPGQKGPKPNMPGPTYAYYDVPLRTYNSFSRHAELSAGGAVWDYLRVRGSKWDHRHPYRLVGGVNVPLGGVYVPRKATKAGLRKRALPQQGIGRRGFRVSQLPEMSWSANRGRPNRGTPDRGEPDRGRP